MTYLSNAGVRAHPSHTYPDLARLVSHTPLALPQTRTVTGQDAARRRSDDSLSGRRRRRKATACIYAAESGQKPEQCQACFGSPCPRSRGALPREPCRRHRHGSAGGVWTGWPADSGRLRGAGPRSYAPVQHDGRRRLHTVGVAIAVTATHPP